MHKTLVVLHENCSAYQCLVGRPYNEEAVDGGYFVAMLLRKEFVDYESHEVVPFYSSKMARCLLQVKV